jgi:bla regulator protein BlaR1
VTIPGLFSSGLPAALLNHLWQSTVVTLLACVLTIALRGNSARVRYTIWLAASIKFLLPFQLLADAGASWSTRIVASNGQLFTIVDEVTLPIRQAPFTASQAAAHVWPINFSSLIWACVTAVWICGVVVMLARWISGWRKASVIAAAAEPIVHGREFDALVQARNHACFKSPLPLLVSSSDMEPGIFGLVRPVLLWPARLSERLDDAQIEAIMAHELEHARRRDNLSSAIHSFVEGIFWFYPLVRWMGARLSEERERACDERVLQQNTHPEAYAQSILKVCSFCMEPASACVSGVSGADLKQRILRIMTTRPGIALSIGRKLLLSAAALFLIAVPVGFGIVHGQPVAAGGQAGEDTAAQNLPKYEVATVKPSSEENGLIRMMMTPDGAEFNGVQAQMLLQQAFGVERDRIDGVPDWARSKRFDIVAKVSPEDAPKLDNLKLEQRRAMLLPLLEERFGLKYHHETRELPMYSLVIAKGGPKLKVSTSPAPSAPGAPGDSGGPAAPDGPVQASGLSRERPGGPGMMRMSPGGIEAQGGGMQYLAHALSALVGRSVVDKTGLTGNYDFSLTWTPDESSTPRIGPEGGGPPPQTDASIDPNGPTLFTALEEQLGLKLQSEKGKVDVIVVDHINLAAEN